MNVVVSFFCFWCLLCAVAATQQGGGSIHTRTGQTVLIVMCDSDPNDLNDAAAQLSGLGLFSMVMTSDCSTVTPSLATLQAHDVVVVAVDSAPYNSVALGNNLASYIDGGGAVVSMCFDNADMPIGGNYNTNTYRVYNSGGFVNTALRTLGTINDPTSPIMQGITSFSGGPFSSHSTSTSMTSGSWVVASYDNGDWLVACKENVGPMNARRVDLNFYVASDLGYSHWWDHTTQGALIIARAIQWATFEINASVSPSRTPSVSVSRTVTPSKSVSPSVTSSPSISPSVSPTRSPSPQSQSSTTTPSRTPSVSLSVTPTASVTPSITPTASATSSVTPSVTPSISTSSSRTPSPTPSSLVTHVKMTKVTTGLGSGNIELTNQGTTAEAVSFIYLCVSGPNTCAAISCPVTSIAPGATVTCDSGTVLDPTAGSVALCLGSPTGPVGVFLQYGAANQFLSARAVMDGAWADATQFLPVLPDALSGNNKVFQLASGAGLTPGSFSIKPGPVITPQDPSEGLASVESSASASKKVILGVGFGVGVGAPILLLVILAVCFGVRDCRRPPPKTGKRYKEETTVESAEDFIGNNGTGKAISLPATDMESLEYYTSEFEEGP